MEKVLIEKHEDDYETAYVGCPKCDNGEEQSADEQRHHFGTFAFDWLEDMEDRNEISKTTCKACKHEFLLEWDFDNIVVGD